MSTKAGRSIGRAVIKVRGTRIAVSKQSAIIANARIIARNPRHRIRWTTPLNQGIVEISVDGEIGIRANGLKNFHADPADRIIVATALYGHRLVTADRRILDWPGDLYRLDATQ